MIITTITIVAFIALIRLGLKLRTKILGRDEP